MQTTSLTMKKCAKAILFPGKLTSKKNNLRLRQDLNPKLADPHNNTQRSKPKSLRLLSD